MPVFSVTAPQLTPEEERQELESLSRETRQQLHDEINGQEQEILETEDLLTERSIQLHQFLDEMPFENKTEYLDAIMRVPELVSNEANPDKFLRCERYNAKVKGFCS